MSRLAPWLLAVIACAGRGPEPARPPSAAGPEPASAPPVEVGAPSTPAAAAVPPADAGTPVASRLEISGCLTAGSEAEAARFTSSTRAPFVDRVRVSPAADGVLVTHELTHACCLSATVATRLDGRTAAVREILSGTACRCICSSTLRTTLALPPGSYTLVVEVEDRGRTRKAHEGEVTVRATAAAEMSGEARPRHHPGGARDASAPLPE